MYETRSNIRQLCRNCEHFLKGHIYDGCLRCGCMLAYGAPFSEDELPVAEARMMARAVEAQR